MNNDTWLERWLPLISDKAKSGEILEIGCGWGWDTAILSEAGLSVFAIDKAELTQAKEAAPKARFQQIDVRDFFPVSAASFSVIVASLSLHYFSWHETERLIVDIHQALNTRGLLLFRANSTEDVNHGATGYPRIEHHFYQVDMRTKRFFDKADLVKLFDNRWQVVSQEKMEIDRFDQPKVAWELILEKATA